MEDSEATLLRLEKDARIISDLQAALDAAISHFGWDALVMDWLQEELAERAEEEHPSDWGPGGLSCQIRFTA
jgi:hypothetical protein